MQDSIDNLNIDTDVIDTLPQLSLDIKDERELIRTLDTLVRDSQSYWDKKDGYNLSERRKRNRRYYLGEQLDKSDLYPYQIPFIDNQLFVATEAITAYTTARTPNPEVLPAGEEPQDKIMAEQLEWGLRLHSEKHNLKRIIECVERNMYQKLVGVAKLVYDPYIEDIVPKVINPDNIVIDKSAALGEEPKFVAEFTPVAVEELFDRFPKKKQAIKDVLGFKRMTVGRYSHTVNVKEVWFTQYDGNGETSECVAWYFNDLLLDAVKNPNFLYDGEGLQISNFLPKATKPYIFMNYINDGTKMIDQTTPFEQAIPLQDALNKRGRQIIENADTANSILVLRSGALPSEEAQNITRDPNQILILKTDEGVPLESAYGEIAPHLLPAYVINDKQDLKNSIHNIMGTPSQFRGDDSNREVGTLGEARMMQSQASGRQDKVIEAIDQFTTRYFCLLVQMMKVWYDEPKKFVGRESDGNFIYVELSQTEIPDIAVVTVEAGSGVKIDKVRQENISLTLAKLGVIDPYNLYRDLGLKDADKRYEALVKYKMQPDALAQDVKNDIEDRTAYIDYATIMNGQDAEPHNDVGSQHIMAHRQQLLTDKFLYANKDIQQKLVHHIQQEVDLLSQRVRLQEAAMQGLLTDPNIPITPEIPQAPVQPQMPQMPMGGGQGVPQGMPPGMPPGMPAPQAPMPVPPPQAPIPQQGVLNGLLGG